MLFPAFIHFLIPTKHIFKLKGIHRDMMWTQNVKIGINSQDGCRKKKKEEERITDVRVGFVRQKACEELRTTKILLCLDG